MSRFEPGFGAVEQAFADADHRAGDDDLVAHLGVLTRARAALMDDGLAENLQQRQHALDGFFVAADHDRERGVARADIAAGDGRVDGIDPLRLGSGVNLFRQARLGGGHVDDDAAGLHASEHAVVGEVNFPHIARITDHGEDDVRLRGHGPGRIGPLCALVEQRLRLGFGAIVNGDGVAFSRRCPHIDSPMTPVPIQPSRVVDGKIGVGAVVRHRPAR